MARNEQAASPCVAACIFIEHFLKDKPHISFERVGTSGLAFCHMHLQFKDKHILTDKPQTSDKHIFRDKPHISDVIVGTSGPADCYYEDSVTSAHVRFAACSFMPLLKDKSHISFEMVGTSGPADSYMHIHFKDKHIGPIIQSPIEAGRRHLEAQIMDGNRMASMARDAPMALAREKVDPPFWGNLYLRSTHVNLPVGRSVTWDAHAINDKKVSGSWHSSKYMPKHSQQHILRRHTPVFSTCSSTLCRPQVLGSVRGLTPRSSIGSSGGHIALHHMQVALHCPFWALHKEALLVLSRFAAYQSAL